MKKKSKKENLETRPPVVVVLGHVDHGKTKLLDTIRKTNVIDKEAGGITQHIGAYEIEHDGKRITFIDTPGHEAFSNIRSRGAKAADIAILVVAADEGVKPQTKEAIQHAKSAGIPVVVVINKIDKPEANPEKVKGELKKLDIVVESLGGDVPSVNISAKEGKALDDLLDVINLVAEIQNLKGNPAVPARGVVLESHLDHQRGPTATLLITEGTLRKEDWVVTGSSHGKVKILENFRGDELEEAHISQPVLITGITEVCDVGETFEAVPSEKEAEEKAKERGDADLLAAKENRESAKATEESTGESKLEPKTLPIIIKADVLSSLEAIRAELEKISSREVSIRLLRGEAGDVDEDDVKLAFSSRARIFGFGVRVPQAIQDLATRSGIKIITSNIIYEFIQKLRDEASRLLEPEVTRTIRGKVKILALFKRDGSRQVIGGKVVQGEAKKGAACLVVRGGIEEGKGRIIGLQRQKKDVDRVLAGEECGMLFEGNADVREGDTLEFFEEETKKRSL